MRLLHANDLRFEVFYRQFIPPFAILSHTWSYGNDKEVSFKKFTEIQEKGLDQRDSKYENAYNKILRFCDLVSKRRIFNFDDIRKNRPEAFDESDRSLKPDQLEAVQWVWIDTCCIDDSSSMEVFEAINSMWWWYYFAEECFVYLVDLKPPKIFEQCRWFERGWTLQELLAPRTKTFCNAQWEIIGYVGREPTSLSRLCSWDLHDLTYPVYTRTEIHHRYLEDRDLITKASIAERLSWAVGRDTLKVEDRFYCLLGILEVNMYPLYGEGLRGFYRLQEEILKSSRDQSLFCWRYVKDENPGGHAEDARIPVGMFAPHIGCFRDCGSVKESPSSLEHQVSSRNIGLEMQVQLRAIYAEDASKCMLHLMTLGKPTKAGAPMNEILVIQCNHGDEIPEFYRSRCNDLVCFGEIKNFCGTLSVNVTELNESRSQNSFASAESTSKSTTDKIHIEKVRFLQTQCEECRIFDQRIAMKVKLFKKTTKRAISP